MTSDPTSNCDQCPVPAWLESLRRAHRFLVSQALYAVVLSSLLACGIYAGRVFRAHSFSPYHGLVWNLLLAWAPYVCSVWIAYWHHRHPRRWWYLVLPSALWLVFFPNAPYIVTDLWHLRERPPIPMWYDIGLFVAFAWTGCFLAIVSLRSMQAVVKTFLGQAMSWIFVFGILAMSGFGIYLGRFLRWNSWDLIFHPRSVLLDVAAWLIHPRSHLQTFGFSFLFAAILLVCYLTFTSLQHNEQA